MSIIRKASEMAVGMSTLVFGDFSSGKSTAALEAIKAAGDNGLWVCFDNVSAVIPQTCSVAVPSSWSEFEKDVIIPIRTGELKFDWVVLDGLNVALGLILNSPNPTQQVWAEAGTRLKDAIIVLRAKTQLAATVAIVDKEFKDDNDKAVTKPAFDLNPDSQKKILPLFISRWFCYTSAKRDEKKQIIGVDYNIQKNGAMALRFTKG